MSSSPSQPNPRAAVSPSGRSWALFEHGLLVFERRLGPAGPFRVLVSYAKCCPERQCDCRDVTLTAVGLDVGTDFAGLELSPEEIRSMLEGPGAMHALLDIDVGSVQPDQHGGRSPLSSDWVAYVQSQVDGELLDRLYDRWLQAKGWRRREPCELDLPALEPGVLVGWHELHPDDRRDIYLDQDVLFLASEFHCVNPDCACAEATIDFAELLDERSRARSIGCVRVHLPDTLVIELTGPRTLTERLWSAFLARYPRAGERLLARKQRLAEIARLRAAPSVVQPAAAIRRVGRNDPCPCGSGIKYKRCCASQNVFPVEPAP